MRHVIWTNHCLLIIGHLVDLHCFLTLLQQYKATEGHILRKTWNHFSLSQSRTRDWWTKLARKAVSHLSLRNWLHIALQTGWRHDTETNVDSVKLRARNTSCRTSMRWAKSNLYSRLQVFQLVRDKTKKSHGPKYAGKDPDETNESGTENQWKEESKKRDVFITKEANTDKKTQKQETRKISWNWDCDALSPQTQLQLGFL